MFEEKNYGLVPMVPDAGDEQQQREAQMNGIADYLSSAYDEESAARTKERYGAVPDVTNESERRYWAGVAFARANGVPNNPEAYWLGNKRDIPEGLETREQMYEALGGEIEGIVRKDYDERKEKQRAAEQEAIELRRKAIERYKDLAPAIAQTVRTGAPLDAALVHDMGAVYDSGRLASAVQSAGLAYDYAVRLSLGGISRDEYEAQMERDADHLQYQWGQSKRNAKSDVQRLSEELRAANANGGGEAAEQKRRSEMPSREDFLQQARAEYSKGFGLKTLSRDEIATLVDFLSDEDGALSEAATNAFILALTEHAEGEQVVISPNMARMFREGLEKYCYETADAFTRTSAQTGYHHQYLMYAPAVPVSAESRAQLERLYSPGAERLKARLSKVEGTRLTAAERADLMTGILAPTAYQFGNNAIPLALGTATRGGVVVTSLVNAMAYAPMMINERIGDAFIGDQNNPQGRKSPYLEGAINGTWDALSEGLFAAAVGKVPVVGKAMDAAAVRAAGVPGVGRVLGAISGNGALRSAATIAGETLGELVVEDFVSESGSYVTKQMLVRLGADLSNPEWKPLEQISQNFADGRQAAATVLYCTALGLLGIPQNMQAAHRFQGTVDVMKAAGLSAGSARSIATAREKMDEQLAEMRAEGATEAELKAADELFTRQLNERVRSAYLSEVAGVSPEAREKRMKENRKAFLDEVNAFAAQHADLMPRVELVGVDAKGGNQYRVFLPREGQSTEGVVMSEAAAFRTVENYLNELKTDDMRKFRDALLNDLRADGDFIVSDVNERMDAAYFRKLAERAKVAIEQGADEDSINPDIDAHLTLGQLKQYGASFDNRVGIWMESKEGKAKRAELDKELGRPCTDDEFRARAEKLVVSNVNRQFVESKERRYKTLFRVASGEATFSQVWEDVVEDSVARDMAERGRDVAFYARGLREVERVTGENLMGKQKSVDEYNYQDVIEGMGKLVRSKVLADTVGRRSALPKWLNDFLDMVRAWVRDAADLFHFGQVVNRAMKEKKLNLEPEFREVLEELTLRNTERLQRLSVEESSLIMRAAATRAANAAAAPALAEAGLKHDGKGVSTPIADAAEKGHGAEVRAEGAKVDAQKKEYVDDVSAAAAKEPGNNGAQTSAEARETDKQGEAATEPQKPTENGEKELPSLCPAVDAVTDDPALRQAGYDEVTAGRKPNEAVAVVQALAALRLRDTDAKGSAFSSLEKERARRMAKYVQRMRDAAGKRAARAMKKGDAEMFARWSREKAAWENGAWVAEPQRVNEVMAWDGKSAVSPVLRDGLPGGMTMSVGAAQNTPALFHMDEERDAGMQSVKKVLDNVFSPEKKQAFLDKTAWGRSILVNYGKIKKKGSGAIHVHEGRIKNGFTPDEAAFILVCAMKAAESVSTPSLKGNKLYFDRFGVRAVVADEEQSSNPFITGFVLDTDSKKEAVDSEAAQLASRFYALDELSRIQEVGAAVGVAIARFENIVKNNPRNWEDVVSHEIEMLKIKQNARYAGHFMKAPNGAPTNLTERQWLQVRTKAFKKWFGDWENDPENASKVLDENGEPLVVYHITDGDFVEFDLTRARQNMDIPAFFFSSGTEDWADMGSRVMACFLNIRNPKEGKPIVRGNGREVREQLIAEGYDGTIDAEEDVEEVEYAAFHPNQIKSATDNRGTYSALTDDITMSMSDAGETAWVVQDDSTNLIAHLNDVVEPISIDFEPVNKGTRDWMHEFKAYYEKYLAGVTIRVDSSGHLVLFRGSNTAMDTAAKGVRSQKRLEAGENLIQALQKAYHLHEEEPKHKAGESKKRKKMVNGSDRFHVFGYPVTINGESALIWMTATHPRHIKRSDSLRFYEFGVTKETDDAPVVRRQNLYRTDAPSALRLGDILVNVKGEFNGMPKITRDNSMESVGAAAPEGGMTNSLTSATEEQFIGAMADAGVAHRSNTEFTAQMLRELKQSVERVRALEGETKDKREKALVAIGAVYQLAKVATVFLPKGYKVNVRPQLSALQVLAELSQTGKIDFTKAMASKDMKAFVAGVRKQLDRKGLDAVPDILSNKRMEGYEPSEGTRVEDLLQDYAGKRVASILEDIVGKVSEQLRRHAKDDVVRRMVALMERVRAKRDRNKILRGSMSADDYRQLEDVAAAMEMNEEEIKAKLVELDAKMESAETEEERDVCEDQQLIYNTFGDVKGMSFEAAQEAYDSLLFMVRLNRFRWEDKLADKKLARRAVIDRVVLGLGRASDNKFHDARLRRPPTKRLKQLPDILSNMPQVLLGMSRHAALRDFAETLAKRVNEAGERMKKLEEERFAALEAIARQTLGKSWRKAMDYMHAQHDTGIAFDSPVWKTVSIRTEFLRELLALEPEARRERLEEIRKEGGLAALNLPTEADIAAAAEKLSEYDATGVARAVVETKYVERMNHTDSLHLSRGEALYAVLMFEQPTYQDRLIEQGYTFKVVEQLKDFVNEELDMLSFGYGMRDLFAAQGERLRVVYEEEFGIPWPQEENYFAAKWIVPDKEQRDPAQALMGSMAGTAGSGKDFLKPRTKHNLRLDTNRDALQVFLQATRLSDNWLCTQSIVGDLRHYMRDSEFDRAMTVALGEEAYKNLKDWVNILEMGGAQDCINMGVSQDVVSGIYGSGAVAMLGLNFRTIIRQTPAVLNGLLGSPDITATEWLRGFKALRDGSAPMTFSKMMESDFIKSRKSGNIGEMKGQAMRSGYEKSSTAEEFLSFAMNPMESTDAFWTALSLVPIWNAYYYRAMERGASEEEATKDAWERTKLSGNLASQGMGFLNKSKVAQIKNPFVKGVFYMLSEDMGKTALCVNLAKGGHKAAAVRAWLMYGATNAIISAVLDALTGDPDEWEDEGFWKKVADYALSTLYGPLASLPLVGETLAGVVNSGVNLVGDVTGVDALSKFRSRATVGRALIDINGGYRAGRKMIQLFTDGEGHHWSEYVSAISQMSRVSAIATGWTGTMFGYASLVFSVLMNPVSFLSKVERNAEHWLGEE